ncbi:hypothetical protein B7P43_G13365, partial [Cryptotermes secundus]
KDLEDIVAELKRDHPDIVRAKEERVEVHRKLTNLTALLEKRLHDHKTGHDNPEDDKKIRDELTSAALSIKQLDNDNEKLIIYGNNLSSWFSTVAAAHGSP